jgi:hypothetical protein
MHCDDRPAEYDKTFHQNIK